MIKCTDEFKKLEKAELEVEENKDIHIYAADKLGCKVEDLWLCSPDILNSFDEYNALQKQRYFKSVSKYENAALPAELLYDCENNRYLEFNSRGFSFMFTFNDS